MEHGKTFFEPVGRVLQAAGIRQPNPLNPAHAWALKGALLPYATWRLTGEWPVDAQFRAVAEIGDAFVSRGVEAIGGASLPAKSWSRIRPDR